MKKTTIVFDCFGVLCAESIKPWLLANIGSWEAVKEYFYDIARRFDLDETNEKDLAEEFSKKVSRPAEQVQEEIDSYLVVDLQLVGYIRELKAKGYKVGLLSNGHHTSIERRIFSPHAGLESLFDQVIVSSRVGLLKPSPEMYSHALSVLGSKAHETVFIDDNEKNVQGAEAVGITGILYTTLDQLKKELDTLLI